MYFMLKVTGQIQSQCEYNWQKGFLFDFVMFHIKQESEAPLKSYYYAADLVMWSDQLIASDSSTCQGESIWRSAPCHRTPALW